MLPPPANNTTELATIALSAVQTISSVAQTTLTAVGILLGIGAFFGFMVIYNGCKAVATKVAHKNFKDYMETPEFHNLLKEKISKGIEDKFRSAVFVNVQPEIRRASDEPGFTDAPRGSHDPQ